MFCSDILLPSSGSKNKSKTNEQETNINITAGKFVPVLLVRTTPL
jgi:hypothetical protein